MRCSSMLPIMTYVVRSMLGLELLGRNSLLAPTLMVTRKPFKTSLRKSRYSHSQGVLTSALSSVLVYNLLSFNISLK